jgi:hypothetical protein
MVISYDNKARHAKLCSEKHAIDEEKLVHCSFCPAKFKTGELQLFRTGTQSVLYACTIFCLFVGGTLERHLLLEHDNMHEKKYTCPLCPDRQFSGGHALEVHMKRHRGQKFTSDDKKDIFPSSAPAATGEFRLDSDVSQ